MPVTSRVACAIKSDATLACWGWNDYGQLGDGTSDDKALPTYIGSAGTGVLQVAAGRYHLYRRL